MQDGRQEIIMFEIICYIEQHVILIHCESFFHLVICETAISMLLPPESLLLPVANRKPITIVLSTVFFICYILGGTGGCLVNL